MLKFKYSEKATIMSQFHLTFGDIFRAFQNIWTLSMSKFKYIAMRLFKLQFNIGIIKSKLFIENLQGHRGCQKHTVSSQDFRSFSFLSFSLSEIVQLNFFREIAIHTSRLVSFDNFFLTWSWLVIFYDFNFNFLLEGGQILERS